MKSQVTGDIHIYHRRRRTTEQLIMGIRSLWYNLVGDAML